MPATQNGAFLKIEHVANQHESLFTIFSRNDHSWHWNEQQVWKLDLEILCRWMGPPVCPGLKDQGIFRNSRQGSHEVASCRERYVHADAIVMKTDAQSMNTQCFWWQDHKPLHFPHQAFFPSQVPH